MLKTTAALLVATSTLFSIAQSSHAATVSVNTDFTDLTPGSTVTIHGDIAYSSTDSRIYFNDEGRLALEAIGFSSDESLRMDFDMAVNNLMFDMIGLPNSSTIATAKIDVNGSFDRTVDIIADQYPTSNVSTIMVDFSDIANISGVEIELTQDNLGFTFGNISYEYNSDDSSSALSVPEPTAIVGLLVFGGVGLLGAGKKTK
ncbi:MAG: hypothetical protein AB4058_13105 [Microcystaceae cyanobacterium]